MWPFRASLWSSLDMLAQSWGKWHQVVDEENEEARARKLRDRTVRIFVFLSQCQSSLPGIIMYATPLDHSLAPRTCVFAYSGFTSLRELIVSEAALVLSRRRLCSLSSRRSSASVPKSPKEEIDRMSKRKTTGRRQHPVVFLFRSEHKLLKMYKLGVSRFSISTIPLIFEDSLLRFYTLISSQNVFHVVFFSHFNWIFTPS